MSLDVIERFKDGLFYASRLFFPQKDKSDILVEVRRLTKKKLMLSQVLMWSKSLRKNTRIDSETGENWNVAKSLVIESILYKKYICLTYRIFYNISKNLLTIVSFCYKM